MDVFITLAIMAFCLICEGFFSGSEIGVVSADRMKLRHQAAKGSEGAKLALKMLKKPEWLLSTTLVGTNIMVVTNTTMATALMIELFGPGASWLAVVLVAPLIWVFGEIVPKSIFQQRADQLTPRVIFALKFFSYLFWPILVIFSFLTRLLSRLAGDKSKNTPFTLREQIKTMVQMSAAEGDIEPIEQDMIRRLFNFGETDAHQVMTPLIDVVSVERSVTCRQARRVAIERSHARIPVYQDRVDKVVGVLDALELLGVPGDEPIEPFIKQVSYVPAGKIIHDLLVDMRRNREQLAVVVDEFGGAEGIVSIEDILEQVVEDIQDEYDAAEPEPPFMRRQEDGSLLANARVDLEDLAEELGVELPKGRYSSLAGFMLEKAGEVLAVDNSIDYKGLCFTVTRGSARSINEVKIEIEAD